MRFFFFFATAIYVLRYREIGVILLYGNNSEYKLISKGMKINLRMLCMGLAAATTMASFAQEPQDFTSKLWNHDFEKGVNGWDIVADQHNWYQGVKGDAKAPGYHGFNNICLENWKSAGSGVTDNEVSQTVTDLPDGMYVFGAYMLATNDSWEESIDQIQGVYMFANEQEIPVATHRVEGMDEKWAHTAKFNVAVRVTGGTLKVGIRCESTNASFICMDNATLWYFGENMEAGDALDEMARIDMKRSVAIADTCVVLKMNVDTLAYLNRTVEAAKALTKAEDAYLADEEIYWGMRLARKSAADYKGLADALAVAKEAAAKEWSGNEETAAALEVLDSLIAAADVEYEEGKANRAEIEIMKSDLNEATALLELDSCYILLELYDSILYNLPVGEAMGEYTDKDAEQIAYALDEVRMLLGEVIEGESPAAYAKEECGKLFDKIDYVLAHPITFTEFPIVIGKSQTAVAGKYLLDGCTLNKDGLVEYKSPLYTFEYSLSKIRFIVKGMGDNYYQNGYPYFAASGFEMFDANNEPIEITSDMISSNADHNALNPDKIDGEGLDGLLDGDPATYFHSAWQNGPKEWHYLEVELPEGQYNAFSFKFISRQSWPGQLPSELEIVHVTDVMDELLDIVTEANQLNPYQGTAPGFYNVDVTGYREALAHAEAAIADNAPQNELEAAYEALKEELEKVQAAGRVMPDPEKTYRVVTTRNDFITKQGLVKGLTIYTGDPLKPNWLWWETMDASNDMQEFMFEAVENDEGKDYYAIKHASTGMYLGDLYDIDGNRVNNCFGLTADRKDLFELQSQGYGQFAIVRGGMIHMGSHNSGNGTTASTVLYPSGPNDWSSWWIRELVTLPHDAKSVSEESFKSETLAFYQGVNFITLTADKECAFENLVVCDVLGNELPVAQVNVSGATAAVMLDGVMVDALMFSFANAGGVETVTVNATVSKLSNLQAAYDKALAVAPVYGDGVGQVSDLLMYDNAIAAAEEILFFGASDEEIAAAITALEDAVAGLVYNQPVAGQEYFIISSVPFFDKWGAEMVVYAKDNLVYWGYWNINDMNQRWKFVDCGELKNGVPAYYLMNVGTDSYLSPRPDNNGQLSLVEDTAATVPWDIRPLKDGKVSIGDTRYDNGRWSMNPMNHKDGTGAYSHGTMFTWTNTDVSCGMYIVTAEKVIEDFKALLGFEDDIEIVEMPETSTVKGTFDLFGRRIETPVTTGIYIVDGKKRVIKK